MAYNKHPDRRADLVLLANVDTEENVVGAINASYIPAKDGEKPLEWSLVNINYVVSDSKYRGKGAAAKLYPQLSSKCSEIAARAGETIRYVVGETVNQVESLVNRTGRARLYFERDGVFEELAYAQAPLEWEENGEPQTEEVPLHLMANPTDGSKKIPTEDVLRIVDGIYDENSRENAKVSCSPEGYASACRVVAEVFSKLKTQLEGVHELVLITKEERERLQAEGKGFVEHEVQV